MKSNLIRLIILNIVIIFFATSGLFASEYEHLAKGDLLRKQGKLQEAIIEYEKEINEYPSSIAGYKSLGYVYQYELKNYDKALAAYLKGLQVDSNDYGLNLNIMHLYFEVEDINKGIHYYELLSSIRPGKRRYSFQRKTVHKIIKNMTTDEKVDFCTKYLKMNPTDIILRDILVDIYKEQKKWEKAKHELEMMLEYGENSGDVYFNLGTCYYNLDCPEKAMEYFLLAKKSGTYVPEAFLDDLRKEIDEIQHKKCESKETL